MGEQFECHNFLNFSDWFCVITYFSIVGVVGKTNIALNKSAQQSSVYQNKGADLAVDGNNDTNYNFGSCTHTNFNEPIAGWWEVDLGENYDITSILIVNRGDCCGERLSNFSIQGGVTCVSETICYASMYSQIDKVNDTLELDCADFTARYIKLQLHESNAFSLCEVEVHGEISETPLHSPKCLKHTQELSTSIPSTSTEESTTELRATTEQEELTTELRSTTEQEELTTELRATTEQELTTELRTTTEQEELTTELRATTEQEELTTPLQLAAQTNTTIETLSNDFCSCSCRTVVQDANVIAETIQEIKDNLTVNTVKLSSTRRKKTSAKDERPSATSVGYMGIVMMSVVFGFFVLQDFITVIWYILTKLNIVSEIRVRRVKVKPASPLMPADTQRPAAPGSPPIDSRLISL